MNLAICSLASGSSGNSYLVLSENAALLVDAGISARQTEQRLASLGLGLNDIDAVLVTHEHQDHIKGLPVLCKKAGLKVLATRGTAENLGCDIKDLQIFEAGSSLEINGIAISSCRVSHDAADPACYCFKCGGRQISIVTDTGIVTDEVLDCMRGFDILVLESNHDENILRIGRYPWFLKQRILGDQGHLSNEAAAKALARVLKEEQTEKKRTVLLGHLSKENNFPEMALTTVCNVLEEEGVSKVKDTRIETLSRTDMSPLYTV